MLIGIASGVISGAIVAIIQGFISKCFHDQQNFRLDLQNYYRYIDRVIVEIDLMKTVDDWNLVVKTIETRPLTKTFKYKLGYEQAEKQGKIEDLLSEIKDKYYENNLPFKKKYVFKNMLRKFELDFLHSVDAH